MTMSGDNGKRAVPDDDSALTIAEDVATDDSGKLNMLTDITVNFDTETLEVCAIGDVTQADMYEVISEIRKLAGKYVIRRVLVDVSKATSIPPLVDYFDLMVILPHQFTYATCSSLGGQVYETMCCGEIVARKLSKAVRHFNDRATALNWLLDAPIRHRPANTESDARSQSVCLAASR